MLALCELLSLMIELRLYISNSALFFFLNQNSYIVWWAHLHVLTGLIRRSMDWILFDRGSSRKMYGVVS